MKRIIKILFLSLLLSACSLLKKESKNDLENRYLTMASLLENQEIFRSEAQAFSLSGEIVPAPKEGGYRYYVVLDQAKITMYNVRLLAMEEGVNYREVMAASVGVMEETNYHLIPHQANVADGYVKGLSASGTCKKDHVRLRVMVRYENNDRTEIFREFYHLDLKVADS